MNITQLQNKKILIAGYGIEGKATHEFLKKFAPTSSIDIADKKDGPDYLTVQDSYDLVIKSPGIMKNLIYIPYTTATNIFFANTKGITIGVSGTKGKSTTSSLIFSILREAGLRVHLVGNIGNPMLSELQKEHGTEDIYVCELSSYQLDDIKYSPHISVLINFFPEHMNYHGSVEKYWNAKKRIVQFSKETDYFVYNPQFERLRKLLLETKAQSFPYVSDIPFPRSDIPLLGQHNVDNVRAALTVAGLFHINPEVSHRAVQSFKALPHRLENVGTYSDITFYDDAISTTPESTICAMNAIDKIGTIFLGGQDRGYDFRELIRIVHDKKIPSIVFFPDSGIKMSGLLNRSVKYNVNVLHTSDMEEAVKFAYKHTPKGTVCLLSTASPSYSIWKNFEEKGKLFQEFVHKYSQGSE